MKKNSSPKQNIETPWAVYSIWVGATGIGLLAEKPSHNSCYILYSENQIYGPELWDRNYVRLFSKLNDAANYFLENQCPVLEKPYSKQELIKHLNIYFPNAMHKEKQNEISSLVNILNNVALSQSLPKCTKNLNSKFGSCQGCIRQEKAC